VLDQHRSTQRRAVKTANDEAALRADIIDLAQRFGRYGYRRITALLKAQGWRCNHMA
jgi:putative transposase